ncbi:MAG: heavy metal-binding domain-containing protein [Planctomycetota bacterium]
MRNFWYGLLIAWKWGLTGLLIGLLLAASTACRCQHDRVHHGESMKVGEVSRYVCPMHATVTSNQPGTCSICGMPFVKKTD